MFRIRRFALLSALLIICASAAWSAGARLAVSPEDALPGVTLKVTFEVPGGLDKNAWIGIIPAAVPHGDEAVNDQHDVAYQYLAGATHGTFSFEAPMQPGAWDARLNENDSGGRELASASFTVRAPDVSGVQLSVDETSYLPGDSIVVSFSGTGELPQQAWIGLIPSSVPHGDEAVNDQHDVQYEYLQQRAAGTVTFEAPAPGRWDVRLNENDTGGREIASTSFEVRAADVSGAALTLARQSFIPGEPIEIGFTASAELPAKAWIGVVPAAVPHGKEEVNDQHDVDYAYLEKRTSGTLTLHAPVDAGTYDVRLNENDSGGRELAASTTFTVSAQVSAADLERQLAERGRVSLYGVRFATNSAELDPMATATLDQVVALFKNQAGLKLRIEGHTDNTGDAQANLDLSRRRAEAVKSYLVGRGIPDMRLTTAGFGASQPVASNDRPEGRALNRRVELVRQ